MIKELAIWADLIRNSKKIKGRISLESIYLGGGTPTLFKLDNFFAALKKDFDIGQCQQINLESTPDALDEKKIHFYKNVGVSRLLIGVQSLNPNVLKMVNRFPHQALILEKVFKLAKKIGIPNITFELIAGLPGQTKNNFIKDLSKLIKLKPDGIHVYHFIRSPLTSLGKAGYRLNTVSRRKMDLMFLEGEQRLKEAHYMAMGDEWILPNKEKARNFQLAVSRPNLITIGPSASGSIKTANYYFYLSNTLNIGEYQKAILKNRLPIKRYFILREEELIRRRLINDMRFSKFEVDNDYNRFEQEFNFLAKRGIIMVNGSSVVNLQKNDLLWPKIFYSSKIIQRCERLIKKKYGHFLDSKACLF